jgi:hypothetical protein
MRVIRGCSESSVLGFISLPELAPEILTASELAERLRQAQLGRRCQPTQPQFRSSPSHQSRTAQALCAGLKKHDRMALSEGIEII